MVRVARRMFDHADDHKLIGTALRRCTRVPLTDVHFPQSYYSSLTGKPGVDRAPTYSGQHPPSCVRIVTFFVAARNFFLQVMTVIF